MYLSGYVFTDLLMKVHIRYLDMSRFMAFFFGVALAKLYTGDKALWKKTQAIIYKATMPSLMIIIVFRYSWNALTFKKVSGNFVLDATFLILDFALFVVVGSMLIDRSNFLQRFFSGRVVRIIGVVSYSLYLNHLMWGQRIASGIVEEIQNETVRMLMYVPLSLLGSFVIAVLLFHYLEKPYFMHRERHLIR